MSSRTIVEFNHDLARQIDCDPDGFVRAIREMLNSGVNDLESGRRRELRRFGVRTSPTHHHSGQSEVVLSHRDGREYWRERFT